MKKAEIIREILMAVNASAEATKGTQNATKKADGDLFFSLAFCTKKELLEICKKAEIKVC
jgi:hypothetical protein